MDERHNAIRDLALKRIDQAVSKAARLMMSGAVPSGLSDLIVDESQLAPDVILMDPHRYNSMRDDVLGWQFPWWKPEMADRLPLLTGLLRQSARIRLYSLPKATVRSCYEFQGIKLFYDEDV